MFKQLGILTLIVLNVVPWLAASDFSVLSIYCFNCQAVLSDYRGNRVGYDKKNGTILNEMQNGSYDYEDYSVVPWYHISLGRPNEGLYTLVVIGTDTCKYNVSIRAYNEMADIVNNSFSGILSRGEEQRVEILYSPHTYDTTTIRKIMDAAILEKELKSALKHKMISGGQSGKKLRKFMSQAAKAIKQNKNEIAVANIQQFIEILEQEKVRLHKEGIQEPPFATPRRISTDDEIKKNEAWKVYHGWKNKYIFPVDILISDAKLVLENMQTIK